MVEIELKAWIDDTGALEERLASIGDYLGRSEKRDGYWSLPGISAEELQNQQRKFRLREESGVHTVTYKDKTLSGAVEVNLEKEFQVSSPESFIELMERVGCVALSRKHKISEKYRVGSCLVESVKIEGLGDFVEIEILAENDSPETVKDAKSELFSVLDRCGIAREAVESRFYSDMLADSCAGCL